MISYAAEVPRRGNPSDAARISPSLSDRASSPVSQYFWNLVDEWSSAAYNREHSYESHQLRAPIPFIQPQFSPFHRPCEETECCHQMRERKPQERSGIYHTIWSLTMIRTAWCLTVLSSMRG